MEIFLTADTHFNHSRIIKYCNRPFSNVNEMNEALIENWNSVVGKKDHVYHLGDFAYGPKSLSSTIFHRLNGKKHLVSGNHDDNRVKSLSWTWVKDYHELVYQKAQNQKCILFHFPIEEWNGKFHGFKHFHGHSHGRCREDSSFLRHDVGVDVWDYKPVHIEELLFQREDLNLEED